MKYLKQEIVMLLMLCVLKLTESQSCPENQFRLKVVINQQPFTCCVPREVRTIARCTRNGGYVTQPTTSPTMTTLRLITGIIPIFTRPTVPATTPTTTEPTTTTTTPTTQTTPTTITTIPETTSPGNDAEEGSGDETNVGTVGEGQDEEGTASTGLSIGIPLVVVAVVIVTVLLIRVRYKRKKESNVDINKLTANGQVFLKPAMGGNMAPNDGGPRGAFGFAMAYSRGVESEGAYQDFEQHVRTSPPDGTYDSLHLYGNTTEAPHSYEQVPEKIDPLSYESLHVYSNSQIGQPDYDTPTPRALYANLKVQAKR